MSQVDLNTLVGGLALRRANRTEADVQADIRTLLLYGGLNLEDPNVRLESPAPERRRIDVEVGSTVIEVKRDLRVGNTQRDGVQQLEGYVIQRTQALGRRYGGILTDGALWELYSLDATNKLNLVSSLTVEAVAPDERRLTVWLETVLATGERIPPLPREVDERLGATSAGFKLEFAELQAVYRDCAHLSEVKTKRELWARLLSAALGTNFTNDDDLFIEHTYLVIVAELIAHGVIGFNLAHLNATPREIVSGKLFHDAGISGVVEQDFFDWPVEIARGESFVAELARRLSRFEWASVEHDVLKVLYESVITTVTRRQLGEYYTPDWLAERMVSEVVDDPANQRVLDPACGSGTFLFWAIRRCAEALEAEGNTPEDVISGVASRVYGIDLHPVAVTLARVTYLLALGASRLKQRPDFSVPVYLGDSIQFAQNTSLVTASGIEVLTTDGRQLFSSSIFFPEDVIADAGQFDRLVAELADKAKTARQGLRPAITAILNRYEVDPKDRPAVETAFSVLCDLHVHGRDHIWGYYVRNLARPIEFTRPQHRVDRLVGNPPWLAARFMYQQMRDDFVRLARERGILGGHHAQRDLSALFVARSVELYLGPRGRFGFVMPRAALSRGQFEKFRKGDFSSVGSETKVEFDSPWDIGDIVPPPFPVPAAVIFGTRSSRSTAMPAGTLRWSGTLPDHYRNWTFAQRYLRAGPGDVTTVDLTWASPYGDRFRVGAPLYPRLLLFVEDAPSGPLGAAQGRRTVVSRASTHQPWQSIGPLRGVLEEECLFPVHLGETVVPFRTLEPCTAVIPWIDGALRDGGDPAIDRYPGVATWWRQAEDLWRQFQPATNRLSLIEKIDYVHALQSQFQLAPHRILYTKAGTRLAAARLDDSDALIETNLYWAAADSVEEAQYLSAVLNSSTLGAKVTRFQAQGLFGPRHFDKYVWKIAVPSFDPGDIRHNTLAAIGGEAEQVAAAVQLPVGVGFQRARALVRTALELSGVSARIEVEVQSLLP